MQLGQKDYVVVDIRETQAEGADREAGDVSDKCTTVFFKQGDCTTSSVKIGKDKEVVTVTLDS